MIQMVVHLVMSRVSSENSPWRFLFIGFCLGALFVFVVTPLLCISQGYSTQDCAGITLTNVFTVIALGFCYFTFVNLNYSSLRIRMLREFFMQGGSMPLSEMLKKYNNEIILSARLERLVKSNQLIFDGQYYRPGASAHFSILGSILSFLKRILLKKIP